MTAKEFNRCLDALPNDRNALEKIYNEYYLQLVYTALSMTKNREAAYDIASTVMLKLAGYRRTEWINSPAGFLIRMVHNVTKDYFRKENRCMEALPEEIAAASDLNSQLFYEDAMDSFTAEEKLIVTERLWGYNLFDHAVSSLTERDCQAEALFLCDHQEKIQRDQTEIKRLRGNKQGDEL